MVVMHAVVFSHAATDSSATAVLDVATPVPAAGEVTIEVIAAGVNFLDVMARRGDPGYVPGWPFVPGVEVAELSARSERRSKKPSLRASSSWPSRAGVA